jgi:hypothetical protein
VTCGSPQAGESEQIDQRIIPERQAENAWQLHAALFLAKPLGTRNAFVPLVLPAIQTRRVDVAFASEWAKPLQARRGSNWMASYSKRWRFKRSASLISFLLRKNGQGSINMSLSYAGGNRNPSVGQSSPPVIANPGSGVVATGSGLASSSVLAPSPPSASPVLATPAVSPILQSVERRLRESSYYYLRSIRCAFESGVITLRGRVPTFYLKQTVQSIVEKIDGVEQIVNLVEVFDSRQDIAPGIRRTA